MGQYTVRLVDEANYQHVIDNLQPGSPVKLTADPANPNDPRAVKAMFAGETIGYVERESFLIRAMHDDGTVVASRVHEIVGGGPGELKSVLLEVRTGTDAEAALGRVQPSGGGQTAGSGKKNGCMVPILIAVGVIVGIVMLAAVFGPSKEQIAARKADEIAEAGQSAMNVTAMEIWRAYEANEAAAQQTYGDRPLRITGKIQGIQLDFTDKPFVTLETGNMFQSVQVRFADPSDPAISRMSKGSTITAVCDGASEVVGTPMLKDCVLQ